jgi:cAMP-dependent protein kinase regulator
MDPSQLKAVRIFSGLTDDQLAWLADRTLEVSVPMGTHLVKEGEYAYRFFAVLEGRAAVTREGVPVATLTVGDSFGEMALLEDLRRNADVLATTPMRLATMMSWDFRQALEEIPPLQAEVARLVEERLGGG